MPPTPSSTPLAGSFIVYDEDGTEGDIEIARRVELPDGRTAFTVEYEDVDERWELRLESLDGRNFLGAMSSPDWEDAYIVEMTLWQAPDDEAEWLLLGTWSDDETTPVYWSITLFEEQDEDEDDEDDEDGD